MIVERLPDGQWVVTSAAEIIAGPFASNAEAWRALDRMTGQAVSKREDTAEWSWNKRVHGE